MRSSKFILIFSLYFLLSCCNDSKVNSYSLIISIDDLEIYQHPLKDKYDLKSYKLSGFNVKNFIKKNDIKKSDTILIKMIEGAECLPKSVNLQQLLKNENLINVFIKKFDDTDKSILGYENFILFDTTNPKLQLSLPQDY